VLAVIFFVAAERVVACAIVFSFADFGIFAAVAVLLDRLFAELEVGVFLEATMLIHWEG
jgi:hypothetical protein